MANARILIVEDESIVRKDIQERLVSLGYIVTAAVASGEDALEHMKVSQPDLVLMDIMLKGAMDGIATAELMRQQYNIPVVYLTAYTDPETVRRAKLTGPYGYILKPFEDRDLHTGLEMALYRHQMEIKLKESEEKYRVLVEGANETIATIDSEGVMIFMNGIAAQLLGGQPADFIGKTMWDLFPKEIADRQMEDIRRVIKTRQRMVVESQSVVSGKTMWFNTSIQPVTYHGKDIVLALIIAKDITERKEAEVALAQSYQKLRETQEQLIQSSKMNAMNQLAAGISHELNQPLTGIKGFAQMVLLDMPPDSQFRTDLEKIVQQSERMEAIINNVRSFARKSGFKLEEININKPIEDCLAFLKEQLRVHNISLVRELAPSLPPIRGDANQLQQVFINLITNARDAIGGKRDAAGGRITIKTWFDNAKNTVEVVFSDTGCGIKKENMESIFNPFFTTKSPNGGLGLGLSIVYRIIENHKASISVDSSEGQGTTFYISFPVPAA